MAGSQFRRGEQGVKVTVRFGVTIELHDVPTVRHIRDIEESIRLAVYRLCCQRDDTLVIESREIKLEKRPLGSEAFTAALERIA
jgi:hypothetical protein